MNHTDRRSRIGDISIAVIVTVILIAVISVAFDHYYEFNDDVLMKDILSGAYTGTPNGLNIQMLSPIGLSIACLYRLSPHLPWYGLFLCGCHYMCILLMAYRIVRISPKLSSKLHVTVIVFLFVLGVLLPHIVMAQYTITVAILAATAALYFYTIPAGRSGGKFILSAILPALLVILAFQIRTEMLLLLAPFLAICGVARWSREKHPFDHDTVRGFLGVVLLILAGMAASFVVNAISYSSGEWKVFLVEFDNRTELYDYQYVPPYDENAEFYESIDLLPSDVRLIENYDYALDDNVDGEVLGLVASLASSLRQETFADRLSVGIREYIYRLVHFKDMVYALLILFLYVMLIISVVSDKDRTVGRKIMILILRVGGLMFMRSISWIYIIYGRREPDRIVHSLYIIESVILFAMIVTEFTGRIRDVRYLRLITVITLLVGGLIMAPAAVNRLSDRVTAQESINRYGDAIDDYCRAHPGNFYFEDVYSTIIDGETFNERMFADTEPYVKNYDLLGGWISNSPLFREKLAGYGITDVSDSILDNDNVYVICADEYDTDWLTDHYSDSGVKVVIERVDDIAGHFGVYEVKRTR